MPYPSSTKAYPSVSALRFFICGCNLQSCLQIGNYAARNYAILLVIVPALQAPDVASSRALRIARELDSEGVYDILHKIWTLVLLHFLDISFTLFTSNVGWKHILKCLFTRY